MNVFEKVKHDLVKSEVAKKVDTDAIEGILIIAAVAVIAGKAGKAAGKAEVYERVENHMRDFQCGYDFMRNL